MFRYHIPLWVYAPGLVKPGKFDGLMSQIDIPPTLLGLLGFDYESRFFGLDVFQKHPDRAYIGTYELLGYLRDDRLVQLGPHRRADTVSPSVAGDATQPPLPEDPRTTLQAISDYEIAAYDFTHGRMRALR